MRQKRKVVLSTVITLTAILFMFQQCALEFEMTGLEDSLSSSSLSTINFFAEEPPALLCGQDGYAFLQRNHISRHCASCHNDSGIAEPKFASSDPLMAYTQALLVTEARWHETLTHNQFCGEPCSISASGQVYRGFMQWSDNRTCPQ